MSSIFSVKKTGDLTIAEFLKQEITMHEIEEVKKELSEIIENESKDLLLSFKKLEFISSLVLAALVYVLKEVRKNNGKLKFCELKDKVKEVFAVTDLDKVFDIYPTENEALAKFVEEGVKTA
ncbi:MAG: STAS domain-containing protein [Candidatus Omnitrophota bacterium]